jgi:foldase protein PrsA
MKRIKTALGILLIMSLVLATASCGTTPESMVAKVGDATITAGELDQYIPLYGLTMGTDITQITDKTELAATKKAALEDLVSMEVIRQYYAEKKENVIPETKDAELKTFMDQVNGDEATLKFMADNKITTAYLEKFFLNQYYTSAFFAEITKGFTDPEGEAKKYYDANKALFTNEQVKASHILVATKAEAEAILKELKGGADFATIAKAKSIDTQSGALGGDLGYFSKDQMVVPFAEAAFSTPIGELSAIVESEFGFHIIKVIDKKTVTQTFEEAKQGIMYDMFDKAYQVKLDEMKAGMKITYGKL